MATVLYNCKRCKVGKRVEYPLVQKAYEGYGRYSYRAYRQGAELTQWGKPTGQFAKIFAGYDNECPQCKRPMQWHRLEAAHNPEVKCDARCTGARGHQCECSCGGKNHGADWAGAAAPVAEAA